MQKNNATGKCFDKYAYNKNTHEVINKIANVTIVAVVIVLGDSRLFVLGP